MSCPFKSEASTSSKEGTVTYSSYLKLDKILGAQELESAKHGKPAHDELLFITVHQVYELWFKQILYELDSLRELFMNKTVEESWMLRVVSRLNRVVEILKICVSQIHVLETMTPLGFMEFRDYLSTSSGFQSVQFRVLENKLGLPLENRIYFRHQDYKNALTPEEAEHVAKSEKEPSIRNLVEQWLERTPGLEESGFNFWQKLEDNVKADSEAARAKAEQLTGAAKEDAIKACSRAEETFASIFAPEKHAEAVERGERRLSHQATKGAMMIFLYRDEPLFHLPFTVLQLLQEVDSQLMRWRHNHVSMVQRMIGSKLGTGGSSGYQYLRATVSDRYKVFLDLTNLATFLVPRHLIPTLDDSTKSRLAHPVKSSKVAVTQE
eukprot:m.186590 g.186590  ORF g.186590 m.186590 type:complete len:380 (-) comp25594_c0_seq1:208-1347(-)